jgi:hypothetical protein
MSLINDALKRAKQAQQDTPLAPAPNMEFRPVEHQQYVRQSVGLAVPMLLAMASVLLVFLLWQAVRTSSTAEPMEVKARAKASPPALASAKPVAVAASVTPAPAPAVNPAPAPAPAAAPVTAPEPTEAPVSNPPVLVVVRTEATNPVATEPPKPTLPKVQGIVFHPTRPSVMINGRTLFVGDKVGEFRVRSINQESVTLVGNGQTNVLNLPE